MMKFMFFEEETEASPQQRPHSSSAFLPALSCFPPLLLQALCRNMVSTRILVIDSTSRELDLRHLK